ncbi:MAG: CPBP family intramembrane metalloprotease [Rhodobacteraceae bacterium]|jgi:hypothetical protein|nr:CPBP family intramembrane metalloprotease [Paracoccaceae bacterium]
MGYERHEEMVAPARDGAELWRTVLGFAIIAAVYIFGLVQFAALLASVDSARSLYDQFVYADTPLGVLLNLGSFVFMALGPILVCRFLHARPWQTLVGPSGQATWDFLLAVRAVAILTAVLWLLLPAPYALDRGLEAGLWVMLLPLTLPALFLQIAAEEILFRGYLQSQLAARFRSPLVWMILPSALFAAGHYVPDAYGGNAYLVVVFTFAFGVAAADLTARTGSLGAAMGLHFANNVVAVAIISFPGDFSGLALYLLPFGPDDPAVAGPIILTELAVLGVSWLAIRVALRV